MWILEYIVLLNRIVFLNHSFKETFYVCKFQVLYQTQILNYFDQMKISVQHFDNLMKIFFVCIARVVSESELFSSTNRKCSYSKYVNNWHLIHLLELIWWKRKFMSYTYFNGSKQIWINSFFLLGISYFKLSATKYT